MRRKKWNDVAAALRAVANLGISENAPQLLDYGRKELLGAHAKGIAARV